MIARVHRAASQLDYVALRNAMIDEFTWSFGGDTSAEQAIDEWKKQPALMRRLATATRARCSHMKDRHVECPANVGASWRAGFKVTDGGWKMVYFVGGD